MKHKEPNIKAVMLLLLAAPVLFLYLCYAVEAKCLNPLGCIDPKETAEHDREMRIIDSWSKHL